MPFRFGGGHVRSVNFCKVGAHMDTERDLLAVLSPRQQQDLANLLRTALVSLGDGVDPAP